MAEESLMSSVPVRPQSFHTFNNPQNNYGKNGNNVSYTNIHIYIYEKRFKLIIVKVRILILKYY